MRFAIGAKVEGCVFWWCVFAPVRFPIGAKVEGCVFWWCVFAMVRFGNLSVVSIISISLDFLGVDSFLTSEVALFGRWCLVRVVIVLSSSSPLLDPLRGVKL